MSAAKDLIKELKSQGDKTRGLFLQRFFKTGPGQYAAGDIFLGLSVPLQRSIAKKYEQLSLKDIAELLASPIHELRLTALLILVSQYKTAPELSAKKRIFDFYYRYRRRINNWDLVDATAPYIFGDYLVVTKQGPERLLKMSASSDLWERRIAIVATFSFIKAGRTAEVFAVAKKLLHDEHDLIHKAVGWMLREAGKRVGETELRRFLDKNADRMPRTALRYAIERLPEERRRHYLKIKKVL